MPSSPDWSTDPYLREQMIASRARGDLVRSTLIWTPPFLALLGGFAFFLFDVLNGPVYGGTWFLVVLLGIFSALTGYLAIAAWRDLLGGEREMIGQITRQWQRRDSLVLLSRYIRVEDRILRVDPITFSQVNRGDMVRVQFYPHSGIAVRVERLPQEDDEEEAAQASG